MGFGERIRTQFRLYVPFPAGNVCETLLGRHLKQEARHAVVGRLHQLGAATGRHARPDCLQQQLQRGHVAARDRVVERVPARHVALQQAGAEDGNIFFLLEEGLQPAKFVRRSGVGDQAAPRRAHLVEQQAYSGCDGYRGYKGCNDDGPTW